VTEDVLRSLALSSATVGVDTVVVMQQTQCGLERTSDSALRKRTGADLDFLPIDDHGTSLREDVEHLARTPYLSPVVTIAGFLYDVDSGRVAQVTRWQRPT
jgi:carbonic anhydrase